MFKNKIFLFIVVLCSSNFVSAEIVEGIGEYVHTVETSRLESCGKAKQIAIKEASS